MDIRSLEPYKGFLESRDTPATVKSYAWFLGLFAKFLKTKKIINPFAAKKPILYEFMVSVKKRYKPSTAVSCRNTVSSFYRWAVDMEMVKDNPAKCFSSIKFANKLFRPDPLTKDERDRLVKSLAYSTYSEARLSVAVLLGMQEGMRIKEVCTLKKDQVDLVNGTISFIGKGGKVATLPMSATVKTALSRLYALQEVKYGHPDIVPVQWVLAIGPKGDRFMSQVYLQAQFKKTVFKCKIRPSVHFHSLRHTFGTALYEANADIYEIRDNMRHSSIATSQYYVQTNKKKADEAFQRAFG